MKTILVMRHAKSDWSAAGEEDFERGLTRRGRGDLPRMGRAIAAAAPPQRLLASAARRARETAEGVAACLENVVVHFDERLYLAPPDRLHAVLVEQVDDADSVLLIAHNPGLEQWIGDLCGARVVLPTAGLACVDFDAGDWPQIGRGDGRLRFYLIPRLFKALERA